MASDEANDRQKITNIFNEGQNRLFEINKMINSERKSRDDDQESSDTLRQKENEILKSSGSMLYKLDKQDSVKQEIKEEIKNQDETENLDIKEESDSKWEMFDNTMLHFSGDSSAFQVNKRKKSTKSKELKPIDVIGEEAFDSLILMWDAYMKEEIQQVSNHIYNVIKDYKKSHPTDILEEPVFKFCVKVLQLRINDQLKAPKNKVDEIPLNSVAQNLFNNQTNIKQECEDN